MFKEGTQGVDVLPLGSYVTSIACTANDAAIGSLPDQECCEGVPCRNVAVPTVFAVKSTIRIVCAARSSPLTATPRGTPVEWIGSNLIRPPIRNLASSENPASTPQKYCLFGSDAMSIQFFCVSCPEPALNVSFTASAESSRLMFRPSATIMPPTIGVGKEAGVLPRHSAGFGVLGVSRLRSARPPGAAAGYRTRFPDSAASATASSASSPGGSARAVRAGYGSHGAAA